MSRSEELKLLEFLIREMEYAVQAHPDQLDYRHQLADLHARRHALRVGKDHQ